MVYSAVYKFSFWNFIDDNLEESPKPSYNLKGVKVFNINCTSGTLQFG